MSTSGIKTKFTIDGEKEYKQALSNINSSLKTLKSEMDLAKTAYKDNATSVEALSKTNDILNRQILTQKEKLDTLQSALQQCATAYGESDTRTQRYQQQVNNATRELLEMEQALEENTEALKKNGVQADNYSDGLDDLKEHTKEAEGETTGFGDALDKVADKLGINLPSSLTTSINSLGSFSAATAAAAAGAGAIVTALVKVEQKLLDVTKESAAYADDILTTSLTSNISTETLQELTYASELLDVSLDTITGSLTKLTNKMEEARDGSETVQAVFDKLGITITDNNGQLRDAEDVFYEVIDALGTVSSETERDALAMDLMGKSAQDLNPLIKNGSEALEALAEEAHETGYVLSDEMLQALGAVDDANQRLARSQETLRNKFAVKFAPYAEQFYLTLSDMVQDVTKSLEDTTIVESLGIILESTAKIADSVASISETALPLLNPMQTLLEAVAGSIKLISDAVGVVRTGIDKVKESLDNLIGGDSVKKIEKYYKAITKFTMGSTQFGQIYNVITSLSNYANGESWIQKLFNGETSVQKWINGNATGTSNFGGGLTWVGENGPELVGLPGGSRIWSAQDSRSIGGDTINITVNASNIRELNDLIDIAKNAKRLSRMGGTA